MAIPVGDCGRELLLKPGVGRSHDEVERVVDHDSNSRVRAEWNVRMVQEDEERTLGVSQSLDVDWEAGWVREHNRVARGVGEVDLVDEDRCGAIAAPIARAACCSTRGGSSRRT